MDKVYRTLAGYSAPVEGVKPRELPSDREVLDVAHRQKPLLTDRECKLASPRCFGDFDFSNKLIAFWNILIFDSRGQENNNYADISKFLNSIDDAQLQQLQDVFSSLKENVWEARDRRLAALLGLEDELFLGNKHAQNLKEWLNSAILSFEDPFDKQSSEELLSTFWYLLSIDTYLIESEGTYLIEYCLCKFNTEQLMDALQEMKKREGVGRIFQDEQCGFFLSINLEKIKNFYIEERAQEEKKALLERLRSPAKQE